MKITKAVPTNIITGFLGVGKTTAILHLLANKPANERWAVLVNEFGEIGIDGGLMAGSQSSEAGIFIREVPGGCMCCVSGLPMQMALNSLLMASKPDRLLIEPTGLGHPQEVIESLRQPHYASVIDLRATLTLIDPRRIGDSRYTRNATFMQQVAVADVLVANKSDQCTDKDFAALDAYLVEQESHEKSLYRVSFGEIPFSALSAPSAQAAPVPRPSWGLTLPALSKSAVGKTESIERSDYKPLPKGDWLKIKKQADGFTSVGWRFHASILFDRGRLFELFSGLTLQRAKAICITPDGVFGYNFSDNALTEVELDEAQESCIEGIDNDETVFEDFEAGLLACQVGVSGL
jgi:G3E family GTPase